MGLLHSFFLAKIGLFLFTANAVLSIPCNMQKKAAFRRMFREELTLLVVNKCEQSGSSVSWQQYCQKPRGTVQQCPNLASEPSADFYNGNCIVSYLFATADSWDEDVFNSSESIGQSLKDLFSNLPREECGLGQSDYCDRMTSVCYRRSKSTGECWPVDRICTPGTIYYRFCPELGQVQMLKKVLFRRLNTFDEDVPVCADGDTGKYASTFIIVVLVIVIVGGVIVAYRIWKKWKKRHFERVPQGDLPTSIGDLPSKKPPEPDTQFHRTLSVPFESSTTSPLESSSAEPHQVYSNRCDLPSVNDSEDTECHTVRLLDDSASFGPTASG